MKHLERWQQFQWRVVVDIVGYAAKFGKHLLDSSRVGWEHSSRRTWSLLELLTINANHYVNVGVMYQEFMDGRRTAFLNLEAVPNNAEYQQLMDLVTDLRNMCNYMQMSVSTITLNRIIKDWQEARPTQGLMKQRLDQWYYCFTSELESQLLLIVLPHRRPYYGDGDGDGLNVAGLVSSLSKFPTAIFDAREAGNCHAFERFTACVYHLMRCAEFGLMSVARAATVPEDKIGKGWDGCIQGIDSRIKAIGSTKPTDWQDEIKRYSDLSSWFTGIQKGWRNPVSHAPRSYSESTASGIFSATRTLFEQLNNYGFKQVEMPQNPILPPQDL